MGTKANPVAIGAFVVGATALAVAGLVIFGSGKFFRQSTNFVCFFRGDVNGLSIGAPVMFKGVKIGSVVKIRIRLSDQAALVSPEVIARGIRIPVVIEIDHEQFGAQGARASMDRQSVDRLVDLGLRAQLIAQSFVTGLLAVQLDFAPDTPATFMLPRDASPQEIPTIPTQLEQVQSAAQAVLRKIEDLKLDRLATSMTDAADSFKNVMQAPGLQQTIADLPRTMNKLDALIASIHELSSSFDREQGPLFKSLRSTSDVTASTLEQAKATLARLDRLVDPGAPVVVELTAALEEVRGAARSVRLLADYIERHPSALVRGRATTDKSQDEEK